MSTRQKNSARKHEREKGDHLTGLDASPILANSPQYFSALYVGSVLQGWTYVL